MSVLLEGRGDRPHQIVLARAALEVAQLQIEIALVLPPDHRRLLVDGDALFAMAGGAKLRLLGDGIGGEAAPLPPAEALALMSTTPANKMARVARRLKNIPSFSKGRS